MTTIQVLWGITTILVGMLLWFTKGWMDERKAEYKELRKEIEDIRLERKAENKEIKEDIEKLRKEIKGDLVATTENICKEITDLRDEMAEKADIDLCRMEHSKINGLLHRHAKTGTSGEVVNVLGGGL